VVDTQPVERPVLIHLQIPKTGGTTLNSLITARLGEHTQFHCGNPEQADALRRISPQERDKIDFVTGHYPYGLHGLFSRPVQYVSCLREPRERILSFYRFVKRQEDHPLYELVNSCCDSFSAFLESAANNEVIWRDLDNVQIRLLSGHYDCRREYETVLAKALTNIRKPNFLLGKLQTFADLIERLSRVISVEFESIPRLNSYTGGNTVDAELASLTPAAEEALEYFSKWDRALYMLADSASCSRTAEHSRFHPPSSVRTLAVRTT
jgi:hypothetical protein